MSDSAVGATVLWFGVLYAAALAVPVVIAVALLTLTLSGMKLAVSRRRDRARHRAAIRAIHRVERDRDAAVRDLIAIRQDATRRMQKIADRDVIEGRAWHE